MAAVFLSVGTNAVGAGTAVVRTETGRKADALLRALVPFGFSGTAIIARKGKIELANGYGLADRERNLPMTADSVISIGSITKQFTAAAIMKLQMQKKLSVNDPISKFFTDVPADKRGITIHQLLTHTSGLRSDFTDTDFDPVLRDEFTKRVLGASLDGPPGAQFEYSNAGFSLLAAIVEIASGVPYEQYLRANLFAPAGMKSTGYRLARWQPGQVAIGYDGSARWGTILARPWAPDGPYWELRGNGAIHSTIFDMKRWADALAGSKILSADAIAQMQTPYVHDQGPEQYAYGWGIENTPYGKLVTHNGGNGIFAADFLRFVDRGVVIYIASTNSKVPATLLSRRLARVAFGRPYTQPPAAANVPGSILNALSGRYTSGDAAVGVSAPGGSILHVSCEALSACNALLPLDPQLAGDAQRRAPQTQEALTNAAAGDVLALKAAYGDNAGPGLATRQADFWARQRAALGTFQHLDVVALTHKNEDLAVITRAVFERGVRYITLLWGPRRAQGILTSEEPPGLDFVPQSRTEFAGYDVVSGTTARLRFDPAAHSLNLSNGNAAFTGHAR